MGSFDLTYQAVVKEQLHSHTLATSYSTPSNNPIDDERTISGSEHQREEDSFGSEWPVVVKCLLGNCLAMP